MTTEDVGLVLGGLLGIAPDGWVSSLAHADEPLSLCGSYRIDLLRILGSVKVSWRGRGTSAPRAVEPRANRPTAAMGPHNDLVGQTFGVRCLLSGTITEPPGLGSALETMSAGSVEGNSVWPFAVMGTPCDPQVNFKFENMAIDHFSNLTLVPNP